MIERPIETLAILTSFIFSSKHNVMKKPIIITVIGLCAFILWLFYIDSEREQLEGSPFCIHYYNSTTYLYFRVPENNGGMTKVIKDYGIHDIYWTDSCACVSFDNDTAFYPHYYIVSVVKDEVMPGGIYFSPEGPYNEIEIKELINKKGILLGDMKHKRPKPRRYINEMICN